MSDAGSERQEGWSTLKIVVVSVIVIFVLMIGSCGLLVVGILLPSLATAREVACQVVDAAHLRDIHVAMYQYAVGNDDAYPPHVGMLIGEGLVTAKQFVRVDGLTPPPVYVGGGPPTGMYRFGDFFFTYPGLGIGSASEHILAFGLPHDTGMVNVLYGDGYVATLEVEEFLRAVAEANRLRQGEDPPLAEFEVPVEVTSPRPRE